MSESTFALDLADLEEALRLDLRSDDTFVANNLPRWSMDSPGANLLDTLLSGTGTWRIGTVGALDSGSEIWGIYLDSPTLEFHPATLTGKKGPYGLIYTLGDPDVGEALLLQRRD